MTTIRLECTRAGTLFYEPEGLILRCCLIPTEDDHSTHLLTFQLGYLGPGDITVNVALDDTSDDRTKEPIVATILLRGSGNGDDDADVADQVPGVWLTYVSVPGPDVSYGYTVSGQPGNGEDDLRGELVTRISGAMPQLSATTSVSATRQPLPDSVRQLPVIDWNQAEEPSNQPSVDGLCHIPDSGENVLRVPFVI